LDFPILQPYRPNSILQLLTWIWSNQPYQPSIDFLLLATIPPIQQLLQLIFGQTLVALVLVGL